MGFNSGFKGLKWGWFWNNRMRLGEQMANTSYIRISTWDQRFCVLPWNVRMPLFVCHLTSFGIFPKYVAQSYTLAPRYKPGSRVFDSRWYLWNFSLTYFFRPHCGPEIDSASNRNEYEEYFLWDKGGRCLKLTTLPPLCADCLEMWESQLSGTLRACPSQ